MFSKLNNELKSVQGQVGTGEAELKLANNIQDISKLSAAEEKKSEITNHYYHAKYYCQGYTKGNVGLGY